MAEGLMIHWYIRPDQFLYVDLSFGTFNVVLLYNLPTCTDCNVTYLYISLIKIQQMPILWQLWYLKSSQDFFSGYVLKKFHPWRDATFLILYQWSGLRSILFLSQWRGKWVVSCSACRNSFAVKLKLQKYLLQLLFKLNTLFAKHQWTSYVDTIDLVSIWCIVFFVDYY